MIATAGFYLIFFGVVSALGGLMGFLKAKSKASLIAGAISGALLVTAGVLCRQGHEAGPILGIVVAVALVGRFGAVFARTHQMMPAGIMTILGAIAVVISATAFF